MSAPFVWFDLTVSGESSVREFYADLFGWTIGAGAGNYKGWMVDGEQPWAGILPADQSTAGRWLPYVVVGDLDAATKRAVDLGGRVVKDRTVGPAGTSVTVADPSGAQIALFTPAG